MAVRDRECVSEGDSERAEADGWLRESVGVAHSVDERDPLETDGFVLVSVREGVPRDGDPEGLLAV